MRYLISLSLVNPYRMWPTVFPWFFAYNRTSTEFLLRLLGVEIFASKKAPATEHHIDPTKTDIVVQVLL